MTDLNALKLTCAMCPRVPHLMINGRALCGSCALAMVNASCPPPRRAIEPQREPYRASASVVAILRATFPDDPGAFEVAA